jgi:murein DD-endopeptidase MepM/ murein hydrolase activator NlpD
LLNPVVGASKKSIISFYGDARDGGKRKHEGIDIFAPKGTFIIAPSDGVITSVGYNILGGKVIWMNDSKRKHSYYFAHLDSQIVQNGATVKLGDTLGTVGNTGNARRTRPHLHFGVYQKNSKNPVTYIRSRDQIVSMSAVTASVAGGEE